MSVKLGNSIRASRIEGSCFTLGDRLDVESQVLNQLGPDSTPEQYANNVLADCIRRYRDARDSRTVEIFAFPL